MSCGAFQVHSLGRRQSGKADNKENIAGTSKHFCGQANPQAGDRMFPNKSTACNLGGQFLDSEVGMQEKINIAHACLADSGLARHLVATVLPAHAGGSDFLSDSEISSVLPTESNR
jgi:hypothetical protein